ncbi:MAG: hypothetical protein GYA22_14985 [Bacteroidales bacterium]|nr:hypothetical protein [Bacteroidales bacterium]
MTINIGVAAWIENFSVIAVGVKVAVGGMAVGVNVAVGGIDVRVTVAVAGINVAVGGINVAVFSKVGANVAVGTIISSVAVGTISVSAGTTSVDVGSTTISVGNGISVSVITAVAVGSKNGKEKPSPNNTVQAAIVTITNAQNIFFNIPASKNDFTKKVHDLCQ